MTARKDANSVATVCGISDFDGSVIPVQIDHVTGRVLAELYILSDAGSTPSSGRAAKDVNSVSTILGVTDNDTTKYLIPVIDHRNNLLYADLVIE